MTCRKTLHLKTWEYSLPLLYCILHPTTLLYIYTHIHISISLYPLFTNNQTSRLDDGRDIKRGNKYKRSLLMVVGVKPMYVYFLSYFKSFGLKSFNLCVHLKRIWQRTYTKSSLERLLSRLAREIVASLSG